MGAFLFLISCAVVLFSPIYLIIFLEARRNRKEAKVEAAEKAIADKKREEEAAAARALFTTEVEFHVANANFIFAAARR
jgi:hypothetical protein